MRIITIGEPKLPFARAGWEEYIGRLKRYHQVRVTHIADKHNDAAHILEAAKDTYMVAMEIKGNAFTSEKFAEFLDKRALEAREVSFLIGGPDGLPQEVRDKADFQWRLSQLTFPHDLAMVILAETLYRASTIQAGHPYHK